MPRGVFFLVAFAAGGGGDIAVRWFFHRAELLDAITLVEGCAVLSHRFRWSGIRPLRWHFARAGGGQYRIQPKRDEAQDDPNQPRTASAFLIGINMHRFADDTHTVQMFKWVRLTGDKLFQDWNTCPDLFPHAGLEFACSCLPEFGAPIRGCPTHFALDDESKVLLVAETARQGDLRQ